jgi:16S rRNA (cytosine1402-N4)-methyltransferase
MRNVLLERDIKKVDGILLDLGVSSYQFDNTERGFSYREDAPLDMRMDRDQSYTAQDIVNDYSESELRRIISDYGEEKFAGRIASNIVRSREVKRIETTFELNDIIKDSIPAAARRHGGNPSKKTYQALRIELNKELMVLEDSLEEMIEMLNPGGRLCIITFHSLEDRIVKSAFRTAENPCICPPEFPVCTCGRVSKGRVVNRKPITASEDELTENPRSSSAKLRIFEKN